MPPPGKNARALSLLSGFCFFLSAVEYMIPKPLPFIRLGIANLPLLLALDIMPFPAFLLLSALKICGQALISGTLFSYVFLFSLGGTGVSAVLMYLLRRGLGKKRISLIGTSAAGALASNGVQLVLAWLFVFGSGIRYAAVPILALGIVTGTILGIAAEYFTRRSRWYAQVLNGELLMNPGTDAGRTENRIALEPKKHPVRSSSPGKGAGRFRKIREAYFQKNFGSRELIIVGLFMIPALLFNPDTGMRIVQFLFFWALAWLSGKKNNPLITICVISGIVFFNLLVPYGEILFSVGPLNITSGALQGGIRRAVTLEGLFMLSRCCIRKDIALPGQFGEIANESFRIFSHLGEEFSIAGEDKKLFRGQNWVKRLDELLLAYGERLGPVHNTAEKTETSLKAKIILAAVIVLSWVPLVLVKII